MIIDPITGKIMFLSQNIDVKNIQIHTEEHRRTPKNTEEQKWNEAKHEPKYQARRWCHTMNEINHQKYQQIINKNIST